MVKIISIHSFRGGTGKSNITANLAIIAAMQGFRIGLVDMDVQSPGIHMLFDLEPCPTRLTLNDFLWGRCSVDDAAHEVCPDDLKQSGGQLFIIPASMNAMEISRILRDGYDINVLNNGLVHMSEHLNLDYVLIDTHPGLNEETLLALTVSDVLLVLLRPDRQDFQGTAVTIDVARKLEIDHLLLVLNRVPTTFDFQEARREVENTYKVPLVAMIPNYDEIMEFGSHGIFCLRYPNHPFAEILHQLFQTVQSRC